MGIATTDFPGALDSKDSLVWAANNASTTLNGNISDSATSIVLTSAAAFPASGIIRIDDEFIAYSSKATNTLTVQASPTGRGFESTTAASHTSGATVRLIISAASHNVQSDAIIATQTKIGTGSSTPTANTVLTGTGTGTSAWGQVTNAMLAGSIAASKLVGTDIATVGTITSGTLSTGAVLGGVTVTLGSDATGDLYYRNSSGVLTRLGIGTTGQALTVAAGLPSWASVTAGAAGADTQLQRNNGGVLGGITGATSNGTNVTFGTGNLIATSPSITTSLTTGSTSFDLINTTATTVNFAGAATTVNMAGGSGAVVNLGGGVNAAELRFLEPSGSGTNYTALKAQAQAANVTYTLPAADGTSGQVLSTNGSGTLSWATASGGGGTPAGSPGQVQFNSTGSFGGATGFTYQSGASPNVTITAQNAAHVALSLVSASTPTIDVFRVSADNGTTTHFRVTSTGSPSSPGAGANSERYGAGALASAADSVAFGNGASATLGAGVAIGRSSTAQYSGVAVGNSATAGNHCIAIGQSTTASLTGSHTVVVGRGSSHSGTAGMLIGGDSTSSGNYNIAIGYNATVSHTGSIVLGSLGAVSTAANQMVCGSNTYPIDSVFFGKGATNASPTAAAINGTGGSGSNIAGANLTLAGGIHTGTPASPGSGHVILSTSIAGAAASAVNTLVQRFIVNGLRKALTDATDVNLFEIALPALRGCAGTINFEIFAADATDVQVRRGSVQYSAVNKAGTYTSEIVVVSEAASVSTGTLTATWNILTGTSKITVRVNADTSLTATTFYCVYTLENNSEQTATIV